MLEPTTDAVYHEALVGLPEPVGGLPVGLDFDGTLSTNVWPEPYCGPPIRRGVELLRHYAANHEVIIYTARPDSHEKRIWRWLEHQGLDDLVYDVVCGKPRMGLMVDDRAYNPFGEICE